MVSGFGFAVQLASVLQDAELVGRGLHDAETGDALAVEAVVRDRLDDEGELQPRVAPEGEGHARRTQALGLYRGGHDPGRVGAVHVALDGLVGGAVVLHDEAGGVLGEVLDGDVEEGVHPDGHVEVQLVAPVPRRVGRDHHRLVLERRQVVVDHRVGSGRVGAGRDDDQADQGQGGVTQGADTHGNSLL